MNALVYLCLATASSMALGCITAWHLYQLLRQKAAVVRDLALIVRSGRGLNEPETERRLMRLIKALDGNELAINYEG